MITYFYVEGSSALRKGIDRRRENRGNPHIAKVDGRQLPILILNTTYSLWIYMFLITTSSGYRHKLCFFITKT